MTITTGMKLLVDTKVIHLVCKQLFPFYWFLSFTTNRIYDQSCFRATPSSKARGFSVYATAQLRGGTVLEIGESPVSGMKATGIPPHIAVAKKVSELQEQLAAIRSEMKILKTTMTNSIPNEVASKVVSEMRQHFVVNGVVPVSLRDIDMRIDKWRADLSSEFVKQFPQSKTVSNVLPRVRPRRRFLYGAHEIGASAKLVILLRLTGNFPLYRE
ncbi:hypothetical protein GQ600_1833 [Phytophthora cactorum]|nr:hypothetical protein GQ600_1833 [Phytophthora cactorum]